MLSILALIVLFAATGGTPAATPDRLCPVLVSSIEPDMRVPEEAFTREAAAGAAANLREQVLAGDFDQESMLGAMNRLKLLQGHLLRQSAIADAREYGEGSVEARESTRVFCDWLGVDGFYYD